MSLFYAETLSGVLEGRRFGGLMRSWIFTPDFRYSAIFLSLFDGTLNTLTRVAYFYSSIEMTSYAGGGVLRLLNGGLANLSCDVCLRSLDGFLFKCSKASL